MEAWFPVRSVFGFLPPPRKKKQLCCWSRDTIQVWMFLVCLKWCLCSCCFVCFKPFYLSLCHHGKYSFYPLDLILAHWQDIHDMANNNSMTVKKHKWVTFCSAEWSTFNVGWPAGGTFDPATMDRVEQIVYCPHVGHPDQVPYIVTWRGLINRERGPYPWVKTFLSPQDHSAYVLATRTGDPSRVREAKAKPQVFQRGTPQELFSSPYLAQPASSAPAGPNFLLQALE